MKPEMRFEGFEEEWERNEIKDISKISSGGTPNRKNLKYWNGEIPWITTSEVKFNKITKANEFITGTGLNESSAKLYPVDTILIAMYGQGATRGKSAILKIEASTNQACAAILVNENIDYRFLYQILSYNYEELRNLSNEGSQKNLSLGLISSFCLKIPSRLEEQRKIASFFSLLDEKTEKQQEKIGQLKELKKGMMQKIFTQEIRFKDGNGEEFPEWEDRKLANLGRFSRGGSLSKSDLSDKGRSCLLYGELYTLYGHVINKVFSRTEHNEKAVIGMKNDVLMPSSGETAIDIACASALEVDDVLLGGDINIFRPNENVSGSFISYQINSIKKNELAVYAQGSSVVHLYNSEIKKVKVFLPTFAEQQKIVGFLSEIDWKIEREVEKIPILEEQKKGFMQRMFV